MVADLKTSIMLPSNWWEGSVNSEDTGVKGTSPIRGRTDQDGLRFYHATQNSVQVQVVGGLFLEFKF